MATTETNQMLAAAVAACEDKKAEDIRILALDPSESGLADYFLICNGTNDRQNVAITDEIEFRLKRDFRTYPASVEGRRQGEWVLMDYVDFIVHVFSPEKRAFYGLERLRKSATSLSVEDLNEEIRASLTVRRKDTSPTHGAPAAKAKVSAKKAPAKKTAAKKMAAKKAATEKQATKKASAKTLATKGVAPKPAVPKKAAKKAVAKSPATAKRSDKR